MKKFLFILALQAALLAAAEEKKPACCITNAGGVSSASPAPFTDKSLYQLDSIWNSAEGRKLKLADLRGKPQVITMFFARCELACPVLIHDMKRIEAALPSELRGKVDFLLVSFDSERDTPEALRAYRERQELDPATWTLLQGRPDDVLELGALLGIKFKKDPQGQFAHSNVITVLNPAGEIVHQQNGLNLDVAPAIEALQNTIHKVTQ